MARTDRDSYREMFQKHCFSRWLNSFVDDGTFSGSYDIARSLSRREGLRHRIYIPESDVREYLIGDTKPTFGTAFDLGEVIGTRARHVCGITGLFTGDFVSQAIVAANTLIPDPVDASMFLASIPLANYSGMLDEGNAGFTTEMRARQRLTRAVFIARNLSEAILERHRPWSDGARIEWMLWSLPPGHKPNEHMDLTVRAALALEQAGTFAGDEISDLCLLPLFRTFGPEKCSQPSRQELLYTAGMRSTTGDDCFSPLTDEMFADVLGA